MIQLFDCLEKSDHFGLMIQFCDVIVILNFVEMGLFALDKPNF